jgi:peroxiredoxin
MMELEALQAVFPQIREAGGSLVAISPQHASYGRAVRRRAALEFDVLSDERLKVAQAFGLVFTLPSYLEELYRSFGKTLDRFHGEPAYRLPLPARYVVNRQAQIRAADVNADYTVRPDPEETVAELRGLSESIGNSRTLRRRAPHPRVPPP